MQVDRRAELMSSTVIPTLGESACANPCTKWCEDRAAHLAADIPYGEIRIHRQSFGDYVGVEFAETATEIDPVVIDLYIRDDSELSAEDALGIAADLTAAAAFLRSIQ